MDKFNKKIQNRCLILYEVADAVRLSSLVQKSLSGLDLRIREDSPSQIVPSTCCFKAYNFSVFTEENVRKMLTPSRRLLYTLHLDIPHTREYSLTGGQSIYMFSRDPSIPHIGKISLSSGLHFNILWDFIQQALNLVGKEMSVLRLILKIPFLKKYFLAKQNLMNTFVDCFYHKTEDVTLLKHFINCFQLPKWITLCEKPKVLSFLLENARCFGKDFEAEGHSMQEIIFLCISRRFFLNFVPVLQYTDTIIFSPGAIDWFMHEVSSMRLGLSEEAIAKGVEGMNPERTCLMLLTVWIFLLSSQHQTTENESMALRLIWNSSPHSGISFKEVEKAFGENFSEKELWDLYNFYQNSVGKFVYAGRPRSLKHLCRSNIRRSLRQRKVWIPNGIQQIGLPKSLQLFLNLEMEF